MQQRTSFRQGSQIGARAGTYSMRLLVMFTGELTGSVWRKDHQSNSDDNHRRRSFHLLFWDLPTQCNWFVHEFWTIVDAIMLAHLCGVLGLILGQIYWPKLDGMDGFSEIVIFLSLLLGVGCIQKQLWCYSTK